jgi:hypothetical protein
MAAPHARNVVRFIYLDSSIAQPPNKRLSEPCSRAIFAVFLAECSFQRRRFLFRPPYLHRDDHHENQKPDRPSNNEDYSGNYARTEHINRIAELCVKPMRHQMSGLRRNRKRAAKLEARNRPAYESHNQQAQAGGLHCAPDRWAKPPDQCNRTGSHGQRHHNVRTNHACEQGK